MRLVRMILHRVKREDVKLTTALLIAEVKNKWNFIARTGRRVSSAYTNVQVSVMNTLQTLNPHATINFLYVLDFFLFCKGQRFFV